MCGTEGSWYLLPTLPLWEPCERRVGGREGGPHTDGYEAMGLDKNHGVTREEKDGIRASPSHTFKARAKCSECLLENEGFVSSINLVSAAISLYK